MREIKSAFEMIMEKTEGLKLSPEEKATLERKTEIESIVGNYLRRNFSVDGLHKRISDYENGMVRYAQLRLIETIRSFEDYQRQMDAIIALEKARKRDPNLIEEVYKEIEELKPAYEREKYEKDREFRVAIIGHFQDIEREVGEIKKLATKKVNLVRSLIDSIKNIPNTPEWKQFIVKLDETYSNKLKSYRVKLVEIVTK